MTLIMGIVNVTPDSFSDGGRFLGTDEAIAHARALRAAGADILDIGGESTRPGAERVSPEVEQERVLPVIAALAGDGAVISVDTMNASTAVAAVAAGAVIVNDVSGGLADAAMLDAVAATGADIVLQHWRGPSAEMYVNAQYSNIARELATEIAERVRAAAAAGISPDRVIVDPGIGFGKQGDQNWQALRGLDRLVGMGPRVLVGASRKRFLAEALDIDLVADPSADPDAARRDLATAVTSVLAAQAGVWAVRVHDVAATRDALTVWRHWQEQS